MQGPLAITVESIEHTGARPEVTYPDVGDFLPIAVICAVSILLSVLWVVVIGEYARTRRDSV